jgi:sugar (pentulose or hexulose) kinase
VRASFSPSSLTTLRRPACPSLPERKFSPELIALTAPDQASALAGKLCDVELDPGAPRMGTIGPYFAERYGFRPDCIVAPFTGDNPSTLLSFTLSPCAIPSPFCVFRGVRS